MKQIIIVTLYPLMLSFMACNNPTTVNEVNEETEVVISTIEQVDTVQEVSIVDPPHQSSDEVQARQAYNNGDAETLKSLAKQGNKTAISYCNSAGINYQSESKKHPKMPCTSDETTETVREKQESKQNHSSQMSNDDKARQAYANANEVELKRLAQKGNKLAKSFCERAGIKY